MQKAAEAIAGRWAKAKPEEMVFVLLGRDIAAPGVIEYWCSERVRLGKNTWEDAQIKEAFACAAWMRSHKHYAR